MSQLNGKSQPQMIRPLSGPKTKAWINRLANTECPALTMRRARRSEKSGASYDPIVWARALGCNVEDVEGNLYVDLISGFGALSIGHNHPRVVEATQRQTEKLIHGLGDVYPSDKKIELLENIVSLSPFNQSRVMLGLNGSDAIAAALKTASLHTKKPGVLAFENSYHGLFYGALAVSEYKDPFRAPFALQLNPHVVFAPWPKEQEDSSVAIQKVIEVWECSNIEIGAVLFEPIQGRGGVRTPPIDFTKQLAKVAHEKGALVIADEILTGLGRCGAHWLSQDWALDVDILCAGKSLGGGYPVSACIGKTDVMQSWGDPVGEAIHTATFQGHPVSCAASLAALDVMAQEDLSKAASEQGKWFQKELIQLQKKYDSIIDVRGRGLMWGVEFSSGDLVLKLVRQLLENGYLVLAAGKNAEVLQIIPPLNIPRELLQGFLRTLEGLLANPAVVEL